MYSVKIQLVLQHKRLDSSGTTTAQSSSSSFATETWNDGAQAPPSKFSATFFCVALSFPPHQIFCCRMPHSFTHIFPKFECFDNQSQTNNLFQIGTCGHLSHRSNAHCFQSWELFAEFYYGNADNIPEYCRKVKRKGQAFYIPKKICLDETGQWSYND